MTGGTGTGAKNATSFVSWAGVALLPAWGLGGAGGSVRSRSPLWRWNECLASAVVPDEPRAWLPWHVPHRDDPAPVLPLPPPLPPSSKHPHPHLPCAPSPSVYGTLFLSFQTRHREWEREREADKERRAAEERRREVDARYDQRLKEWERYER